MKPEVKRLLRVSIFYSVLHHTKYSVAIPLSVCQMKANPDLSKSVIFLHSDFQFKIHCLSIITFLCDFTLSQLPKWDLPSFGILHILEWYYLTTVSRIPTGQVFKNQALNLNMGLKSNPENSVKRTTILRCLKFQQSADFVIFLSTLIFHIHFLIFICIRVSYCPA